jgi:hypothetical protein
LFSYYDICNTTSPDALTAIGKIPFNTFSQCQSTLSTTNCSDAKYGFPVLPDAAWRHSVQPNGTATTYYDQEGRITAPPYGSTTAWHFYGTTDAAITATAVSFEAGGKASGTSAKSSFAAPVSQGQKGIVLSISMLSFLLL